MDINTNKHSNEVIINPLLKNKFEIEIDDEVIDLSILNLSKYFHKLYILTLFKNDEINQDIYKRNINSEFWKSMSMKLVLDETSIRTVKNFEHNHNLIIVKSSDFEQFNHFGLELDEKILVLPIFSVSYRNIKNYLKIFEGNFNLENIYNIVVLNQIFSKEESLSFNSVGYMTDIIKNLDESNYWTRKYNCLHNISSQWNSRMFKLKVTRNLKDPEVIKVISSLSKDKMINDYLNTVYNNKNFVDAASCLTRNGFKLYRISKPCDISKNDMILLFEKLNNTQRYYMFSNLVISKKYCHLVLNNYEILKMMNANILFFSELYRYLFGYAWLRFLTEEGIKKSWMTKDDDFIFDINTASLLPVYPFCLEHIKKNPYFQIKVDSKYLRGGKNLGGISFFDTSSDDMKGQGIVDLNGFKKRFNLFITGNSQNDIFNNLDWNETGMGVSGSVMTACLQKQHPLMTLFKGKNNFNNVSDFDLDYLRYFNEYYPDADVDVMIKSTHPLDFIKKVKVIFNQVVVNICGFNPSNAEPHHVKMKTLKTIYLFVSEDFIKNNIASDEYKFEFIMSNFKDKAVIKLFKPYFDKKIKEFNDNIYEEYSSSQFQGIMKQHPELFDENEVDYQVHISKNKDKKEESTKEEKISNIEDEDIDHILDDTEEATEEKIKFQSDIVDKIGINITYKVKIYSNHLQRPLEIFPVMGDDFLAVVSKFHLPCVRSFYDGNNVYLTPSCITSHMTYMNLDYKYFAGSNDEIKIILKYRMRGFGTLLNRNELDKLVKYASKILFWNRLYNIDLDKQSTISDALGCLDYQHKAFHPRLYNADLYNHDVAYVNINDGYNNVPETMLLKTEEQFANYITNNLKGYHFDIDLLKFQTIGSDGYIKPVQKWLIDTVYHYGSWAYNNKLKKENIDKKSMSENIPPVSPISKPPPIIEQINEEI